MGLGEFAVTSTVRISLRCTNKVGKKAFSEFPRKAFHELWGDSGVEGKLECLLRNYTCVLARLVNVTYDITKHHYKEERRSKIPRDVQKSRETFKNPERRSKLPRDVQKSLDSLRASGCEKLSVKEFFLAPDGDGPRMAEDDVKLLTGLVTIWRTRVAEQTKYVVAARGTRFKSLADLKEDFHIAFERLHGRPRVACIYRLVCKLIERYGRQSVILTGHSLGAAVTFQVCRQLYLEGSEVEGHFFEPPFMTLDKLLVKCLAFWEIEVLFFKYVMDVLPLKPHLDCLWGKLIELSARWLEFDAAAAHAEYDLLRGWHPYMYVQKYDDISNEYIDFFNYNCTHSDGRGMSRTTAMLKKVGAGAQARHLLPSAYLITSDKGVGTLTSHLISNWTDAKPGRVQGAMYTDRNRVRVIE